MLKTVQTMQNQIELHGIVGGSGGGALSKIDRAKYYDMHIISRQMV